MKTRQVRAVLVLPAATCFAPGALADIDPHGGMLRYPDVGATHITFVYANDLWTVPREGGMAIPVASPAGQELFPRTSPDGKSIAFVGNYDGDRDIYVIPSMGGIPRRITHHPATEILYDWTPDGRILFNMNGLAPMARQQQLFMVGADGGISSTGQRAVLQARGDIWTAPAGDRSRPVSSRCSIDR